MKILSLPSIVKYLIRGNAHVVLHIGKHRGLQEVTFVPNSLTTKYDPGTLFLAPLYVVQHFVKLGFADLRVNTKKKNKCQKNYY